MPAETDKVTGRRTLRFENLDDIIADVNRLAAAPNVRVLGNWSFEQILWHLAKVMNDSIDGTTIRWTTAPPQIPETIKRRVLNGSMRPGFKLPPEAAKELEPPPVSSADAIECFRAAVERQRTSRNGSPIRSLARSHWTSGTNCSAVTLNCT
jgi:Protein of unknown function (DUF1569)